MHRGRGHGELGVPGHTWIGWLIIGALLSLISYGGNRWLVSNEQRIQSTEEKHQALQTAFVEQQGRLNILTSEIARLTSTLDTLNTAFRLFESRLTKIEISREAEQERRVNKK